MIKKLYFLIHLIQIKNKHSYNKKQTKTLTKFNIILHKFKTSLQD
jgi:hypothetical protein